MADNHTKEVRSMNMSHIRSKDTKPEIKVRSFLHRHGFRFRKNDKRYPGKPDIVLPKYKTVIYINGCFWHKHDCGKFVWPKSNVDYWKNKITKNVQKDANNYSLMTELGWHVRVLWECEINDDCLVKLVSDIKENHNGFSNKR